MKRVTNTTLFIIIICCLSIICYKFYNYFIDEKLNNEIQSYAPTISDVYLSEDSSQSSSNEVGGNNNPNEAEGDNKTISENQEELKSINNNYEMWIEIPNTKINYPIVQGKDNEYYLKHNFKNESNMSGTIFVDCNNNIDEDKNIIIYGHNMRNGTMFNNITKFKEESFFNNNNTINIIRNNILYQYEIFSIYVEDESKVSLEIEFTDNDAFVNYALNEASKSMYNKNIIITEEDKIITLVTCSYEYTGARTILVGKLKNTN
ncbi:class B sortase [uncultured Clostridium sp.]|uniref:class B sortase n=1 Tax=Clostridium sp. TaxID=1506 RepID=UPI0025F9E591|nr:class B sortase [uncultured Clostridium sp.]